MIIQQALSSHGVSEAFLDALDNLARKPSWWRDVLLRDDVFIAVRANSLNVYHRGASIFRIDDGRSRPSYSLDPHQIPDPPATGAGSTSGQRTLRAVRYRLVAVYAVPRHSPT
jgi:hypothetical protein